MTNLTAVYLGDSVLYVEPPPPPKTLEEVHAPAMARGADCRNCPLWSCGTGPVLGTIRPGAPLIAVGEAPGQQEIDAKEGFRGASGRILDDALAQGGLPRQEVSVTNVILCKQPGDSLSEYLAKLQVDHAKAERKWMRRWARESRDVSVNLRKAVAMRTWTRACEVARAQGLPEPPGPPAPLVLPQTACKPRLQRDLAESNSLVTLAVGREALEQTASHHNVVPYRDRKSIDAPAYANIKKQHGAPILLPDGKVLCVTYHPAFAMRDRREYMSIIRENIARAARIARRNGRIDWEEPPYYLNADAATLTTILELFLSRQAEVTVDIETDSIDPHTCIIRCVGLGAVIEGKEVLTVVPFRHMSGELWWPEDVGMKLALLLRRVLDELPLVFQNGIYDTTALLRVGLMTRRDKSWSDTMLLHHDTPDNDLPHDLGFITRRYYEAPLWKEDVDHKNSDGKLSDYFLHLYNLRDVLATMRVVGPLRQYVYQYETERQYTTDRRMAPRIRDMSELGLISNEWLRGRYSEKLNRQCRALLAEFQELADRPVNPRSPVQLRDLFYVDWGYPPVIQSDGSDWKAGENEVEDGSTSNAALTRLMDQVVTNPRHLAAIEKLLEFRANDKIRGTNVDNVKTYPVDWKAHGLNIGWAPPVRGIIYDEETDREREGCILQARPGLALVRTTYKGHVVPTGRLASGDPINFQNVPLNARGGLNLRDLYVAPPGHVIVGADYEQIEARLYAVIAQDRLLLDAIKNRLDIHTLNAASLLAEPGQEIMDVYYWLKKKPKDELKYLRTVAKRFCIAEGELVLVLRDGESLEVPIEKVRDSDLVWDGVEWVRHEGLIDQGIQEVIFYDGLWATPDHEVWLEDGRKVRLNEAAAGRHRLARSGEGRHPIRFVAHDDRGLARDTRTQCTPQGDCRMRDLQDIEGCVLRQHRLGEVDTLQAVCAPRDAMGRRADDTRVAARPFPVGQEALHESRRPALGELRRSRYRISLRIGRCGRTVDDRKLRFASAVTHDTTRPYRQQWPLRTRQLALGNGAGKYAQSQVHTAARELEVCRRGLALQRASRHQQTASGPYACADSGGSAAGGRKEESAKLENPRRVVRTYDLYCAGPRRRFTVKSVIVSNCFGLIYGAGWRTIFQVMSSDRNKATGKRTFPHLTEADCRIWEENWHRLHPETKTWHKRCLAGYATYKFSGVPMLDYRRRYFLDGVSQENQVPNLTIQGSAASIANRALLALCEEIPYRGWSYWSGMALQVHDYLAAIVPVNRAYEAKRIIEKCMYYEFEGMKFQAFAEISWSWGAQ